MAVEEGGAENGDAVGTAGTRSPGVRNGNEGEDACQALGAVLDDCATLEGMAGINGDGAGVPSDLDAKMLDGGETPESGGIGAAAGVIGEVDRSKGGNCESPPADVRNEAHEKTVCVEESDLSGPISDGENEQRGEAVVQDSDRKDGGAAKSSSARIEGPRAGNVAVSALGEQAADGAGTPQTSCQDVKGTAEVVAVKRKRGRPPRKLSNEATSTANSGKEQEDASPRAEGQNGKDGGADAAVMKRKRGRPPKNLTNKSSPNRDAGPQRKSPRKSTTKQSHKETEGRWVVVQAQQPGIRGPAKCSGFLSSLAAENSQSKQEHPKGMLEGSAQSHEPQTMDSLQSEEGEHQKEQESSRKRKGRKDEDGANLKAAMAESVSSPLKRCAQKRKLDHCSEDGSTPIRDAWRLGTAAFQPYRRARKPSFLAREAQENERRLKAFCFWEEDEDAQITVSQQVDGGVARGSDVKQVDEVDARAKLVRWQIPIDDLKR